MNCSNCDLQGAEGVQLSIEISNCHFPLVDRRLGELSLRSATTKLLESKRLMVIEFARLGCRRRC